MGIGAAIVAQAPGLRLFAPTGPEQIHLVDGQGVIVHTWPGLLNISAHMLDDGSLLRSSRTGLLTNGATGSLQQLAFDGTVVWDILIDNPSYLMHHDIEPMPNGNVLVIAWARETVANAISAGRDPALVTGTDWLPDAILEIERTGPTSGVVVWAWHMMNHVIQDFDPSKLNFGDVASHPELLDINYPPQVVGDGDWNHFNGLDYDPINDWIILSSRSQNEIYLIDHSTTTAEAASHSGGQRGKGGDILYRWGNPQAYRAGTAAHQQLFGQHDTRFLPPGSPGAGNVTLFNNSFYALQSAVFELVLPLDAGGNIVLDPTTGRYGPPAPSWVFTQPGFLSLFVSSAERLPNGNTLICSGLQNLLFEVTAAGQTVWSYVFPGASIIFQAHGIDRSLWADTDELSVGGGQVEFDHLVGSAHAGQTFLLLGSVSGTAPGTPFGSVTLPLNSDYLTFAMASLASTGVFVNTIGTLDGNGAGHSTISAPPGFIPAELTGTHVDFAHIIFDASLQVLHASNPVPVTIVP